MSPIKVGVLAGIAIFAVILLVAASRPGFAATLPARCIDTEVAMRVLVKNGALDLGRYELETASADKLMVFEFRGFVLGFLSRKGCVASQAFPIDYAKDRGKPA